jgi:hypothetical protein
MNQEPEFSTKSLQTKDAFKIPLLNVNALFALSKKMLSKRAGVYTG